MDELHGILTTYAKRTGNISHKEAAFKASKKSRKYKSGGRSIDESGIEMAQLIRKLKIQIQRQVTSDMF